MRMNGSSKEAADVLPLNNTVSYRFKHEESGYCELDKKEVAFRASQTLYITAESLVDVAIFCFLKYTAMV